MQKLRAQGTRLATGFSLAKSKTLLRRHIATTPLTVHVHSRADQNPSDLCHVQSAQSTFSLHLRATAHVQGSTRHYIFLVAARNEPHPCALRSAHLVSHRHLVRPVRRLFPLHQVVVKHRPGLHRLHLYEVSGTRVSSKGLRVRPRSSRMQKRPQQLA